MTVTVDFHETAPGHISISCSTHTPADATELEKECAQLLRKAITDFTLGQAKEHANTTK